MVSRREVITAAVASTVGVRAEAVPAPATALNEQERDREALVQISRAINRVEGVLERGMLSNSLAHGFVSKLRASMEQFFRAQGKFPEFLDIGIGVFMDMYDWHIKHGQQLTVTRGADGRYRMQFMFTTLVLRHEVEPAYIGIPYDNV
jgi:hypothetical protein